ncbi:MAG: Uma2 family endonuclease [Actinomycetota bacterium]
MATQPQTTYTYDDLQDFPEDNLRRELIGGELIVTAAPATRHQQVSLRLAATLLRYAETRGGEALNAPFDVYFSATDVVEPDVLFVRAENLARLEDRFLRGAPDVVVEISSPSTRKLELKQKLDLYERYGVPEYWYVDLEADRIEIYRLAEGVYGRPELLGRGDTLRSVLLPGFVAEVDYVLGDPDDEP